jgi:hypothetical protein
MKNLIRIVIFLGCGRKGGELDEGKPEYHPYYEEIALIIISPYILSHLYPRDRDMTRAEIVLVFK